MNTQHDCDGRCGARHHHPPFAPGAWHDGHGRRGPGGRGPGGRGRAPRGDLRATVLLLLDEAPMHGYQLMQAVADRSGGRWTPSPGAVYPAINQLEDEGLVTVTAVGGRKIAALTDAGRAYVVENRDQWADPFGAAAEERSGPNLRHLLMQLHEATRQVGRAGTPAQVTAAATILDEARRSLYLLLADGPPDEQA